MAWFNGVDKELYIPEDAIFEETATITSKDHKMEEEDEVQTKSFVSRSRTMAKSSTQDYSQSLLAEDTLSKQNASKGLSRSKSMVSKTSRKNLLQFNFRDVGQAL